MPEQGLDEADVGATLQERRGERVAESVRRAAPDAPRLTPPLGPSLDRLAAVVFALLGWATRGAFVSAVGCSVTHSWRIF